MLPYPHGFVSRLLASSASFALRRTSSGHRLRRLWARPSANLTPTDGPGFGAGGRPKLWLGRTGTTLILAFAVAVLGLPPLPGGLLRPDAAEAQEQGGGTASALPSIRRVQYASTGTGTTCDTVSQTAILPKQATAGNLLVVVASAKAATDVNLRVFAPAGFTKLDGSPPGLREAAVFYKISDGTELGVTMTGDGGEFQRINFWVGEYSGVDPTNPIDVWTANDAGFCCNSYTGATNEPAYKNGLYLYAFGLDNDHSTIAPVRLAGTHGGALVDDAYCRADETASPPRTIVYERAGYGGEQDAAHGHLYFGNSSLKNTRMWAIVFKAAGASPSDALAPAGGTSTVHQVRGGIEDSVSSRSITWNPSPTAGRRLIASVRTIAQVSGVTHAGPPGWDQVGGTDEVRYREALDQYIVETVWTKVAAGDEATETWNFSEQVTYGQLIAVEYSGLGDLSGRKFFDAHAGAYRDASTASATTPRGKVKANKLNLAFLSTDDVTGDISTLSNGWVVDGSVSGLGFGGGNFGRMFILRKNTSGEGDIVTRATFPYGTSTRVGELVATSILAAEGSTVPVWQTYGVGIHAENPTGTQSDPVNSATGAFTATATDASLPGIGLPFALTRYYTSADPVKGALGVGWSHSYAPSLTVVSNGDAILRGEDGQQVVYTIKADGSYKAPPGGRSTLRAVAGGYELTRRDQVVYTFDTGGRLTELRDRNNNRLALVYDAGGLLQSVTDTAGRVISFTHNAGGQLTGVSLPDGRSVTYGYTGGLLTSVTDLRGKVTAYEYDASGRLTRIVDPNLNTVIQNAYGTGGRVISQTDPLGNLSTFGWDKATQTSTMTDARGSTWKDVYSDNVLVKRIDPLGNETSFGYDNDLNRTSVTDPRGKTTTMTYDGRGNMLSRTAPAPLSHEETFTYDAKNNLASAKDGRGNTTTFDYETAGNLVKATEPGLVVTQFGRDPAGTGLLTSLTDPRGKVTQYEYDGAGNLVKTTSPSGAVTTMGYDPSGRMTSVVNPRGTSSTGGGAGAGPRALSLSAESSTERSKPPKRRKEIRGRRTKFAKFFQEPNGTFTAEIHGAPIHVRGPGGTWRDIDTTLVRSGERGYAWENRRGPYSVSFASRARRRAMVLAEAGGASVAFGRPEGARAPKPMVEGNRITYPGIRPGVDLALEVLPHQLKESIVLEEPPAEGVTFEFPLALSGLRARRGPDGSIELSLPDGRVEFGIPRPWMEDSSDEGTWTDEVTMELGGRRRKARITVTPDMDWLRDPDRVYPVVIDPTLTPDPNPTADTYVEKGDPSNHSGGTRLKVGTQDGGATKHRSLLKFTGLETTLAGKHVLDADLNLWENDSHSCIARPVEVRRLKESWSTTSVTWANQPVRGEVLDSLNVAKGFSADCPNGWITLDVTAAVANWTTGTWANYGLELEAQDETENKGWKRFASMETASDPYIIVTYNSYPDVPTDLSPASGASVEGLTPTLSGTYSDPDTGDAGRLEFEVYRSSDNTLVASDNGGLVQPGETSSWTVPGTAGLKQGVEYSWRARGFDEVDPSSWSASQTFVPGANTWTFAYDAGDNLTNRTDPLGNATAFTYDPAGNLATVTDPKSRTTTYGYNAANELASVIAPDSTVTSYGYDAAGNLIKRTDAKLRVTTYGYDAANRLSTVTSPTSQVWTYTHDPASNLTKVVNAAGNATPDPADGTITYGYDALNRPVSVDYSDATPDVTYAYDAAGNRTQMTDGSGTETYAYDSLSRLTGVTRGTSSFSYAYDAAGNVTRRTYPDGTLVDYTYTDDGQLASVISGGATTNYSYDATGSLTQTTLPAANGHVETRTYDAAGRLVEVKNAKGGSVLSRFTYTLDAVGNPTRIDTPTGTTTFSYDAQDRLTEVCFQATCPGAGDPFIRYAYDAVGNRTTETRSSGATTYSYNDADQLLSQSGPGGSVSNAYDPNGNQTQAGARTFSHDLANRLASTSSGGTTVNYSYDGDGKRLRASSGAGASDVTNYLWDPNAGLPLLVSERDGADVLLRRYVYGEDLVSMATGGADYYYHHDGLGSAANLTSSAGTAQWTYEYEPFGTLRTETKNDPAAPVNPMRFTGEFMDTSTGLYHLRARQYDGSTGRFLSEDPLSPSRSVPGISTYVYADNTPTVLVDPSGLRAECGGSNDGSFLYDVSDFFAGWGDLATTIPFTGFSLTRAIREPLGGNEVVNRCSGLYDAGGIAGIANVAAISAIGGVRAAGFNARFGLHTKHLHSFNGSKLPHLQLNVWRPGVKGWEFVKRRPLPSSWRRIGKDWRVELWPSRRTLA